jgi:hypothetical protein
MTSGVSGIPSQQGIDGCPMFAQAYVGRKRWAQPNDRSRCIDLLGGRCNNAIKFHRKTRGAKWRDLLFILRSIESDWKRHPPLCHPDRSVA